MKKALSHWEKVSNALFFLVLTKKENIIFVRFSPLLFPFPPSFTFLPYHAAETLCPAMPTAGKLPKALEKNPFNKEHLPNGLDSKPKETKKCHNAVNVPSLALIFSVSSSMSRLGADTMARCLRHPKGHQSSQGTTTGMALLDLGCCTSHRPR